MGIDTTKREGKFAAILLTDAQLLDDDMFTKFPTYVNSQRMQVKHTHVDGSTSALQGGSNASKFNLHNQTQVLKVTNLHITVPKFKEAAATDLPIRVPCRGAPFAMINEIKFKAGKDTVVTWTGRQAYLMFLLSTYSQDRKLRKYFGIPNSINDSVCLDGLVGSDAVKPVTATALLAELQKMALTAQTYVVPLFMLPWGRNTRRNFNLFRADKTELTLEVTWNDPSVWTTSDNAVDTKYNGLGTARSGSTAAPAYTLSECTCELFSFGYNLPDVARSAVKQYHEVTVPMMEMYTVTQPISGSHSDGLSLVGTSELEITKFKGLCKGIIAYFVPENGAGSHGIGSIDPLRIGDVLQGLNNNDAQHVFNPQIKFNGYEWHETTNTPENYYSDMAWLQCHNRIPDAPIAIIPISEAIVGPCATQTLEVQWFDRPRFTCQMKTNIAGNLHVEALSDYVFVYRNRNCGRELY